MNINIEKQCQYLKITENERKQMKIKELHKAKSDLIIDSNAKGSASSAQALSQNTKNDNGKRAF